MVLPTFVLVAIAIFEYTLASTHDLKRQAPDPAVLSAPQPQSSTSSFNWWPYPPGGVDSSSTSSSLDPYWTPLVTTVASTTQPIFSVLPSSSLAMSTGDSLSASTSSSTSSSSTSTSTISLTALPPLTTTTSVPHATISHANHPLLPASPSSPSQSAKKDKVQAIVLGSLLGCALGAVFGWFGVGIWRSTRNGSKKNRSRTAKRNVKGIRYEDVQARDFPEREKDGHGHFEDEEEEVDVFIGQSHAIPFACDEREDLGPHQDQKLLADDDGDDKDTLTRSWLARTFTAHRREGPSLVSSSANVNSSNGAKFLEAPQLSREPTRTAFSTSPASTRPNPTADIGAKRPVMTPAPTIFSSTASSYEYEEDEGVYDSARLFRGEDDENNGNGNGGRSRGLLERLKRWTGAYAYSVERHAGNEDRVAGRGRGRTPELEAGVLYSHSPQSRSHSSMTRSESYQSIMGEAKTSSLSRAGTTTTNASQLYPKTSTRSSRSRRSTRTGYAYGHGRADSDVTIPRPVPSFTLPTNEAERDTYTALPSRVARSQRSRSRSRSTSPVKRTLPSLPLSVPTESSSFIANDETPAAARLISHPGSLPRVDSTVLPLSPPLLSSPPLQQSLMFTSMLSFGQDAGPITRMDGAMGRRGFALVDPPVPVRRGLQLQDALPALDSPYSPHKSVSEMRVAVSQDDSESRSNAGPVIGKIGTGTDEGKNVNGPRKLKSTRRRAAAATVARDKTLPAPPVPAPAPAPAPSMATSTPIPTPRAVGRVLTRKTPGGARAVQVHGYDSLAGGRGTE